MAASNSILQKTQQAARDFIRAAKLKWIDRESIQSGISRGAAGDDTEREATGTPLPSIVCQCQNFRAADASSSGNWEVDLVVSLRCNADDTEEDVMHERTGNLADLFMDYTAALAGLSAFPDYHASWLNVDGGSVEIVARSWRAQFQITVRCCGQTIT